MPSQLVLPLTQHAGDPAQLEARSAFPKLVDWEREGGSLVRGAIAARKAARKSGAPRPARRRGLWSFAGGLAELSEAIAAKLGDAVRCAARVRSLVEDGEGAATHPQRLAEQRDHAGLIEQRPVHGAEGGAQPVLPALGRHAVAGHRRVSNHPATIEHPETGEPVWFNHTQVFHLSAAEAELRRVFAKRGDLRSLAHWAAAKGLAAFERRRRNDDELAMQCTFGDGTPISDADMEHVRDCIWNNLVAYRWQRGDMVAIDNFSVSHGRLPYRGDRRVAVCWA